ncbi:hypothetical protein LXA43DRAFT_1066923 [Ganoderma leucocontextum]|nr:hypothetical protein LXA43DRAFT_1066923 [Ganoderma leucocontextum]
MVSGLQVSPRLLLLLWDLLGCVNALLWSPSTFPMAKGSILGPRTRPIHAHPGPSPSLSFMFPGSLSLDFGSDVLPDVLHTFSTESRVLNTCQSPGGRSGYLLGVTWLSNIMPGRICSPSSRAASLGLPTPSFASLDPGRPLHHVSRRSDRSSVVGGSYKSSYAQSPSSSLSWPIQRRLDDVWRWVE